MQNVGLFPARLQRRLPTRGMPAIPGDVLGNGAVDRNLHEGLVELRDLRGLVPMRLLDVFFGPVLVGDLLFLGRCTLLRRVVRAIVIDEIRRIRRKMRRARAVHQPGHVLRARGVAAQQPVLAKEPQVAAPRYRPLGRLRDCALIGEARRRFGRQQARNEVWLETNQPDVEIRCRQIGEFHLQDVIIPPGVLGELVIGEDLSAELLGRPIRANDKRRDLLQASRLCLDTPVARDDHPIRGRQHRIGEAELSDGLRQLRDLLGRMHARIALVWLQVGDPTHLDLVQAIILSPALARAYARKAGKTSARRS